MLILIDPEFIDVSAHARLLSFLRHPYTEDSCSLVDREIPELSDAYRAMQCSKEAWPLAIDPRLAGHATSIFKPVASIEGRLLPLMSPELSETQVILLQEELRDLVEGTGQSIPARQGRRATDKAAFLALRGAALHEAAFLVLAGLFEVRTTNQLLEFQLTETGKSCMQSRVMGFTLEAQSSLALRWSLLALIESLRPKLPVRGGSISSLLESYMLDMLVARLLDSQFSISTQMQSDHRVAALSRDAGALCRWFAVLEIVRVAGEGAYYPTTVETKRLDLDNPLLGRILSSQKTALLSDRGIRQTLDGGLTLGDSSLEHAITCCKHVVLNDVACRELGVQFEEFVRSYIIENSATDYVVRKGISVSGKDKGVKYECDLILYEPKRRKVFFLQVKWKRDARTANLEAELRNWRNKNWPMTKGVSQLVAIRSRLNESRILDQIRTSLGSILEHRYGYGHHLT